MQTRGRLIPAPMLVGLWLLGVIGCSPRPLPPGLVYRGRAIVRIRDNAPMVYVKPGPFLMGPQRRRVVLPGYYIDKFEVTNKRYMAFVKATDARVPDFQELRGRAGDNQPIAGVTWFEAAAYAKWVGGRLPTEAEWEKAARGVDGRTYPWGEDPPSYKTALLGWMAKQDRPADVGSRPAGASPYGCLDMIGNVWEWCEDWYDQPGQERVIRGGSFGLVDYGEGTCYSRGKAFPEFFQEHIGFRCVVSAAKPGGASAQSGGVATNSCATRTRVPSPIDH